MKEEQVDALSGIVIPNARGFATLSPLDPPINLDNSPYKVEENLAAKWKTHQETEQTKILIKFRGKRSCENFSSRGLAGISLYLLLVPTNLYRRVMKNSSHTVIEKDAQTWLVFFYVLILQF